MRTRAILIAAMLVAAACQPADRPRTTPLPRRRRPRWTLPTSGSRRPSRCCTTPVADVYLVSNINGELAAKDDNGFIARLSPTGEILTLKWIDGAADGVTLHAPKGMALAHDTLFVADIDAVRLFDRTPARHSASGRSTGLRSSTISPWVRTARCTSRTPVSSPARAGSYPTGRTACTAARLAAGPRWSPARDSATPTGSSRRPRGLTVVTFVSGEVYTRRSRHRRAHHAPEAGSGRARRRRPAGGRLPAHRQLGRAGDLPPVTGRQRTAGWPTRWSRRRTSGSTPRAARC